jgi:hypothetical protein
MLLLQDHRINLPKFLIDDAELFRNIMSDLFWCGSAE